ncbi:hypothetical protein [Paractinoplanes hotanensis]|jgi:hypothetical protein|uniref:Uncharacterized protein n=1 Tax=Paractinoplanes hotanensis TaxID=2906497 RepID=A0ABT0Y9K4_9ACTN|nr:hypothetical protein [Actinoplanes hotanensis]MCM4082724.1 hypothetical protein [Actinoplanes hotanensis]
MTESNATAGTPADETEPVDETEPAPEAEAFTNRAARRAKGKSTAKPEVFSKGQRPAGRGSVQSPRQYGNRRSG